METDITIQLIKVTEDKYELRTNLGNSVLSTLNKQQYDHMIELLIIMRDNPPDFTKHYHFPTTVKRVTG